jgi:hypothetical protein
VRVRDELAFKLDRPPVEFILGVPAGCITVRDCIRARVEQEVAAYNAHRPEYFLGLVQPSGAETTLNGYRLPKHHRIDAEAQVEKAVAAFARNGFLMLVDDRQVEELDDLIVLGPETVDSIPI